MKKFIVLLVSIAISSIVSAQENKDDMNPALIVIDIQNEFMNYMCEEDKENAIDYMNYASWIAHDNKIPVIAVYHITPGQGPEEGSDGFKFVDDFKFYGDEIKIIKNFGNAFKDTNLESILKEKKINTLFICGLSSTGCVMATYFGGTDLQYKIFTIKDALIGPKADLTNAAEEITDALSLTQLSFIMEQMPPK